ncbi:acylphosphatase [Vreelandella sp. EE22]
MTMQGVRALVTGKVQGVNYRSATQKKARMEGITGHAHNLPDGRVEVLMCGETSAVQALGEWLWQGPENARVTDVTLEEVSDTYVAEGFTTG